MKVLPSSRTLDQPMRGVELQVRFLSWASDFILLAARPLDA